jgi:hypothetical protein
MKPRPNAVLLVIQQGNVLADPPALRAEPGSRIAFVIFNEDVVDRWVSIEPGDIVLKQDKTVKANPMVSGKNPVKLSPGEVDIIKQRIKPAGTFGPGGGKLPFTTYKYTLVSADDAAGTNAVSFDPDLDVAPPN